MVQNISRRTALRLGGGAVLLGTAGTSMGALLAGSAQARPSATAVAAPHGIAGGRADRRLIPAGYPPYEGRWSHPISSIDDFLRRSPHSSYPHKAIMLTVDDGPDPQWTPKYLSLFARHRIRATFCMIGENVHAHPGLALSVLEHGHIIANHSWNHDEQMGYGSAAHIRWEIDAATHAIHSATGFRPNIFRNPGGVWTNAVYSELANQHMMPLGWNIDPRDWARPGTGAIESAMLKVRPHGIILCHDGGGDRSQTYAALQYVIPRLLDRGLTFVTLPPPAVAQGPVHAGNPPTNV